MSVKKDEIYAKLLDLKLIDEAFSIAEEFND